MTNPPDVIADVERAIRTELGSAWPYSGNDELADVARAAILALPNGAGLLDGSAVVVPREATDEMCLMGSLGTDTLSAYGASMVWQDMIAAAHPNSAPSAGGVANTGFWAGDSQIVNRSAKVDGD